MSFKSQQFNVCINVSLKGTTQDYGELIDWFNENINRKFGAIYGTGKIVPFDNVSWDNVSLHLENDEDVNLVKLVLGNKYKFEEIYRRRPIC